MKRLNSMHFFMCILIACSTDQGNRHANTVTGIYVMQAESEFGQSMDTLLIKPYDKASGLFQITSKTGYHKIRNGKPQPKEYKQSESIAIWNKELNRLEDVTKGETYLFPPSGKELLFGSIRYVKIK